MKQFMQFVAVLIGIILIFGGVGTMEQDAWCGVKYAAIGLIVFNIGVIWIFLTRKDPDYWGDER